MMMIVIVTIVLMCSNGRVGVVLVEVVEVGLGKMTAEWGEMMFLSMVVVLMLSVVMMMVMVSLVDPDAWMIVIVV